MISDHFPAGRAKRIQIVVGADHVIELRDRCQHVGHERDIRNRVPVEARILVNPIFEVIVCDTEWVGAGQAGQ